MDSASGKRTDLPVVQWHLSTSLQFVPEYSCRPFIITLTLAIPDAIFTEAFLSFIGLGVNAPMASWGVLASDGISSMRSYPFQLIFPALAISVTMLGFVFLGDGLRNVFDPKEGDR